MLKEKLKEKITVKGISIDRIEKQLAFFREGIPAVNLHSAAKIFKGIDSLNEIPMEAENIRDYKIVNFIPASGAATRMFKDLYGFIETKYKTDYITSFVTHMQFFPFYKKALSDKLKNNGLDLVEYILSPSGLGYGNYPKGLIPFHKYKSEVRTAFEEHLRHADMYSSNLFHFTISKEHHEAFKKNLKLIKENLGKELNVEFSFQKPETDTIAVDSDNQPFQENGELLFRPGGHGALIENLNDIDADIVFIKNIDNVAVTSLAIKNAKYKRQLLAKLLRIQGEVYKTLKNVIEGQLIELNEAEVFAKTKLNIVFGDWYNELSTKDKKEYLIKKLNRPIRVCGMVKNEGQPGGGPFWVKATNGEISLQIVEGAQMDKSDPKQVEIINQATHFNPVDLVCGIRDYKGDKFNLLDFVDPNTAFITEKTRNGKKIKALELPGLWNGAMANWNTIFVEVPSHTFNPVKTVNDLLKPAHQA